MRVPENAKVGNSLVLLRVKYFLLVAKCLKHWRRLLYLEIAFFEIHICSVFYDSGKKVNKLMNLLKLFGFVVLALIKFSNV